MPRTIVEWIPAYEFMKKFERHLDGRNLAGDSSAEYIRDGRLRAKAGEMWVSEEPTVKKARKNSEERRTAEYLTKPFIPQELLVRISGLLDRSK